LSNPTDDDAQIIDDSDDEIIALSDDESTGSFSANSRRKGIWTSSEIQITQNNSQSQSLHNPYRIGIADPSLRSIFLPPPPSSMASSSNSQSMSGVNIGNKRNQTVTNHRKVSPNKRTTNSK
jgi:hypothetical protein